MVAGKAGNAALNTIFYYFYFINLGLCVFNILPIPPLDGFHVASCLFMRSIGPKPFMFLQVRLCDTYSAAYDQLAGRHYVIRSELPDVRNDEHMCSHIRPVRADVTWHTR